MSWPGIEPGPLAWEASTLEKSHLDSLFCWLFGTTTWAEAGAARGLYSLNLTRSSRKSGVAAMGGGGGSSHFAFL
jgi:hypothetical protein